MQLLNSLQKLDASDPLIHSLQDIVTNVQIGDNFCITHPNYKPLELPAEAVLRFQQLPLTLKEKYLSLQLRSFIYGIYYNGSMISALAPDSDTDNLALSKNLENTTTLGVDLEFYARLHETNSGTGYFDPGWQIIRQENDGYLAVAKGGLTLHIERDRHLTQAERCSNVGDIVAIHLPRNLLQNGFYMAVSNAGPQVQFNSQGYLETVRVYFNLKSEGAVPIMGSLTRQLNELELPFTFKVLYNPSDYNRYDSGVLYFQKSNSPRFSPILQRLYQENRSYFREEIPLFTKFLAPGLGLAEEPNDKFTDQESFGMNRCQIIVNGLLDAYQKGDNSPGCRMTSILQQFSLLGIELNRPYLNANSEDIYTHWSYGTN